MILAQRLRASIRSLAKTPALSAAAALVLALSLGAAAALYAVVSAVLLRPLPFPDSERVVAVFENLGGRRPLRLLVSVPAFEDLRAQRQAFAQVETYARGEASLDSGELAEPIRVSSVTPGFFSLLGAQMQLGRGFSEAEGTAGPPAAVLSYELWWSRYGGDPAILGRSITVDGVQRTVVGILPPRFAPLLPADVWLPAAFTAEQRAPERRQYGLVLVLARLGEGVSVAEAQQQMSLLGRRLREEHPEDARAFLVLPLREVFFGDLRPALGILAGAVLVLLVIACANVANLLLVRASARQRETAIRLALGARRGTLAAEAMLESLVLALAGALPGLLVAMWAVELLVPSGSEAIRAAGIEVDGRVLGFTLLAALVTGAVAGLAPSLQRTRAQMLSALRQAQRRAAPAPRRRVRGALVVVEVALALVLVFGAALALRGLRGLLRIDPGFSPRGLLSARLALPPGRYPDARAQARFVAALLERARALPGVRANGFLGSLPLTGGNPWHFDVEGPGGKGRGHVVEQLQIAAPGTLAALGVPLLAGRGLDESDGADATPVALVNEAMARRYWPGDDAVGKKVRPYRFHFEDALGRRFWPHGPGAGATAPVQGSASSAPEPRWFTIVGVVGDVKQGKLALDARPEITLPAGQFPVPEGVLILRMDDNGQAPSSMFASISSPREPPPAATVAALKDAVARLDPDLAPYELMRLDRLPLQSAAQERDAVVLLCLYAALALLMAAMGVYGVVASTVTERTREIGIRLALGAGARSVLRLLLGQALLLALFGIALGWAVSPLVAGPLSLLLLRPLSFDAPLCLAASLVLLFAALLASFVPARKAVRIDPGIAFQHE